MFPARMAASPFSFPLGFVADSIAGRRIPWMLPLSDSRGNAAPQLALRHRCR
jgi:hypothetical protein